MESKMQKPTRRELLWMMGFGSIAIGAIGCGGGSGPKTAKTIVSGIVRNAADNDIEVEGATVLIGGKSALTYTRDNASAQNPVGSFLINDALVGAFTATVTVPGKPSQTIAFQPAVKAGANTDIVLIINIGQVGGRVLAPNGTPAADAFVSITTDVGSISTVTDSAGRFLLENVLEGTAELTASLGPASAVKTVNVAVGYLDIGDVALIDDGNTNPPATANTITGTVTDSTNAATKLAGVSVVLLRNDVQVETTTTDVNGKFGFLRPIGTYRLQVLAAGYLDGDSGAFTLTSANTPPNAPKVVDVSLVART
jgi:hypothetical protein